MSVRRVLISAVSVASLVVCASVTAVPDANATSGTTIYVNNSPFANCSDAAVGSGSATTPFCTIQAALGIVQPGDTILASGTLTPFTVSASGTAAAPITITSGSPKPFQVLTHVQSTGSGPAITISGAGYVSVTGFVAAAATGPAVVITGSNHITLDTDNLLSQTTTNTQPVVHVTGGSSYVTISRDIDIAWGSGGVVRMDGGGTGDQMTTNLVEGSDRGPAITVDGASNAAITSNTVNSACGNAIQVTGGSAAAIENNVVREMLSSGSSTSCTIPPSGTHGLLVDAASAAASTADYNVVDISLAGSGAVPYSWSGNVYATAPALTAATGQGAHDFTSEWIPNPAEMSGTSLAQVDSANANAPGEQPTDYLGNARVDDPVVPNTGVGATTYYDRGALERQTAPSSALLFLSGPAYVATTAPIGATVSVEGDVIDPWQAAVVCDIDFGDGTSAKVGTNGPVPGTCATTHQYTKTGVYTATLSVAYSDGTTGQTSRAITIDNPAPVVPSLSLAASGSIAVKATCSATSGWNIQNFSVDYGDGTTSTGFCTDPHQYQRPGTYVVTMTAHDAGGNSATASASFTTVGDWYTPLTPSRILDTRNGTGTGSAAKVPANGVLRLKVAGSGGIPASGAAAVTLNLTVTNPTAGGYVTAYPDGATRPATSNLNFAAGQTVPNTVIVKVGADGYVDLANISAGSTNLVADVEGYYSLGGNSGYITITPVRVLDTRSGNATIPPGGTARVYLGTDTQSASAVALNVTVANAKAGGYVTAYPDGAAMPKASNVNFAAGQIIQNEAIVKTGANRYVDFTNTSAGSIDLIVDLTGYFTNTGMGFVPITPTRVLDTRPSHGGTGPVAQGATQLVSVSADAAIVPGPPLAVAANITVTDPAGTGFITAYPDNVVRPLTFVLNFDPGQTIPNATTIGVGGDGGDALYNGSNGAIQLIADVFGFYN